MNEKETQQLIKKLKQLDKRVTELILNQFQKTEIGKKNFKAITNEMQQIVNQLNWSKEEYHYFLKNQFENYMSKKYKTLWKKKIN